MQQDLEYRRFMHKHEVHHEAGELEIFTEAQINEKRHNLQRAINTIDENIRGARQNMEQRLTQTMCKHLLAMMEVAEVYSPPRVTEMARRMGLRVGWALDITTQGYDGRDLDFNQLEMLNRAIRKVLQDKPLLIIGSPVCTALSKLNNSNYCRMDPMEVQRKMEYGRRHPEFCTKLYNIQWETGRYFLHEHPASASSWQEKCIQRMLCKHGVTKVVGDQCRYGLTSSDGKHTGLAKKSTGFMTNSPCIAAALNKRCKNTKQHQVHEHVVLINGGPKAAQVYPSALCKAVCQGIRQQIIVDGKGQLLLAQVDGEASSGELMKVAKELQSRCKVVEEDEQEGLEEAWDDVSGAQPDPTAVRAARIEEVEYIHKMALYTKVPLTECKNKTGKAPISVRWIDVNKGDLGKPNYRSRLVAREINTHKREDLCAATPRLEALKLILAMTTSGRLRPLFGDVGDVGA